MRSKTMTIRVDEKLLTVINRLTEQYNCSQSDIIHECLYAFNDYLVTDKNNEMCKYIVKQLRKR